MLEIEHDYIICCIEVGATYGARRQIGNALGAECMVTWEHPVDRPCSAYDAYGRRTVTLPLSVTMSKRCITFSLATSNGAFSSRKINTEGNIGLSNFDKLKWI